jgi:hypothetical protein
MCVAHTLTLTHFNSEGEKTCSSGLAYKFIKRHNPEDHSLNITLEPENTGNGTNKKQNDNN